MKNILVFGHKNPDTDSVCAAISMAYLKNKLGYKAEPRLLGSINDETKFVLDYLKIKKPKYLNDVKLQIKDINYRKKYFINHNESLLKAFEYMTKKDISTIPVVDDDNKYVKSLAMKDIARNQIMGDTSSLSTSFDHILTTLNGEQILKFDDEIKGNIIAASFRSTTFMDTIKITNNDILIVGDRHSIIEYAIKNKAKLLILTNNSDIKKRHLKQAEKNKVNIIKTNLDSFNVSIKIGLSNYIKDIPFTQNLLCINVNDYVSDILELTKQTKYSYYPIVDKNNTCQGLLKVADLNDKSPKQVILVDHNEYRQSADGIEEAEIKEIIDHHRIGSIGTNYPINFRNMPVGASNTIIYGLYKENNIEVTELMAKVMLSGILSDTLVLHSPTTTELDRKYVNELSKIANINYKEYGMEMLKKGANLKDKSINDIIHNDFKIYEENKYKVGIGTCQLFENDIKQLLTKKDEIINTLNEIHKNEKYDIIALFITDIINEGSYIFYSENSFDKLNKCFNIEIHEGLFMKNYISRKKQIIPAIMNILDNK